MIDLNGRNGAIVLVGLACASEFKFRSRDAAEALEGTIDAQIAVEVAFYGLVGVGLLLAINRRGDTLSDYLPGRFGSALSTYAIICGLSLGTSLYAPTLLSPVRAAQFTIFGVVVLTAARLFRDDPDDLVTFWLTFRRALWVVVAVGVIGTLLLQGPTLPTVEGAGRYRWFAMHPISTANILGLAVVAVAGGWYGLPDPLLRRRDSWLLALPLVCIATILLLLTKSRGALAATVGATAVLALLSPSRTRRGITLLVMCVGGGALLLGVGLESIEAILTRNRGTAELRTLTGRTELLGIAYDLFRQRPLTGYGFLAGRSVFLQAVPWAPGHAHNMLAEVAISYGIPGLMAYLVLIWSIVTAGLRSAIVRDRSRHQLIMCEASALLAFVLLAGVVGGGAANLPGFELLALVLAALVADLWRRNQHATVISADSSARPPWV